MLEGEERLITVRLLLRLLLLLLQRKRIVGRMSTRLLSDESRGLLAVPQSAEVSERIDAVLASASICEKVLEMGVLLASTRLDLRNPLLLSRRRGRVRWRRWRRRPLSPIRVGTLQIEGGLVLGNR